MDKANKEGTDIGVFPVTVWPIVFKYLDSLDFVSTIQTNPSIKNLAKYSKRRDYDIAKNFPNILNCLEKEDILKCRQVCKLWRRAVDNIVDRLPLEDDHQNDFHEKRFRSATEIRTSLQVTIGHPFSNPFIGRNFSFCHVDENEEFWKSATEFLEQFGQQIWYVELCYNPNRANYLEWMLPHLSNCLRLMPNLKRLNMHGSLENILETQNAMFADKKGEQFLKPCPFPVLDKLEMFVESYALQNCIFFEILRSCQNVVKTIRVRSHPLKRKLSFASLKRIHLTVTELEDISVLSQLHCPLTTVVIDSSEHLQDTLPMEMRKVLMSLESFSATLEEVYLHLCIKADLSFSDVLFPFLRVLEVNHYNGMLSNFQIFGSLQKLVLGNIWQPTDEAFSEDREAEFFAALGQIRDQPTITANASNEILQQLRDGNHDMGQTMENLKVIWCCGYKLNRP